MKFLLSKPLCAMVLCGLIAGCSSNHWKRNSGPSPVQAEQMLLSEEPIHQQWNIDHSILPQLTVPQNVRPCCAFGDMQKVKIGSMPLPFYRLNNSVDLNDIGPHKFAAGIYHYTPVSASALGHGGGENNGILYTAKGGFIDLAHVRDTADDTIGLFFEILNNLGQEHHIELPAELGPRYIEMKSFETSGLTDQEKWSIAAHLAARLAYFKAESHEIAQWHGYTSFSGWSEVVSAYSLEDLYSNMLGAKIVLHLIINNQVLSENQYNQSVSLMLNASLQALEVVAKSQTKSVLSAVDGQWWDSKQSIPNKYMVLKRHYALGDQQKPYLLTTTLLGKHNPELDNLTRFIATDLSLPSFAESFKLDDIAQLVLEISPRYAHSFNHIPKPIWSKRIVHTQFPLIAQYDEIQDRAELKQLKVPNE